MTKNRAIKKAAFIAVIIVILFIPTYFAIGSYFSAKDTPVEKKSINSLLFVDLNGESFGFDRETDEGRAIIDILTDIHDSARTVSALPTELEGSPSISVSFYSYDLTTTYNYYFSPTKPSNSYYTDHEGDAFLIDASAAIAFLDSDFSASLYEASSIPTLSLGDTDIKPISVDWSYSSYSGVVHTPSAELADKEVGLTCSYRDFALIFDREPTSVNVTVSDKNGNKLFSGSLSELIESDYIRNTVRTDTMLTVDIDAKWKSSGGSNAGGHIVYRIKLLVKFDPLAAFWLGENTIEDGEFVVLSGKYIESADPSAITVKVEPDIGYTPKFYTDGDCVRALVPFAYSAIELPVEYKVIVGYAGKTVELPLTVKPQTAAIKERKYNYKGEIDMSTRSDANLAAFTELIATLPIDGTRYFEGSFLTPDEKQNRARFADTVNNGRDSQKHISNGVAWVCYSRESVNATNKGKVCYVGQTKMGGVTIVIDHGLGLRSVYYCLSSASVAEGDIVEKGVEIGKGGGKSGYTDDHTCYFELWVGNTPVSYYPLTSDGRNGEVVIGNYD